MATIKSYYANQNEYLYDLNKSNPYFDPTVYSEIGNDYLPLALLYKENPSEKFSQQTYNYLSSQDKVNYLAVLSGLTDTKEYSQEEQLKSFDAVSKQMYEQKQWDEKSGFEKALNTVGSFLGNMVTEAWGVLEGLIDLGAGAVQLISGGAVDTREFIAQDLTGVSAMRQDLAEFNKYNTFLQEGFGKWLYGATGSISRLWTMFVPVVGQGLYYGSLGGSSLEETYKTLGPDSNFWEATLRAGLQTGAEWAGERLFGDLVFGKGLINLESIKVKNALLHIGINMIGEGVEEVVTESLNYISDNFMTLLNKDYSAFVTDTLGKDLLDAFMTGALMGGLITSFRIPFTGKVKLPNGTILNKNQSLLFKKGLMSDELKKISRQDSEIFKLKNKSKDGVLDTNSVEYAKALEKDNKQINSFYKAAKTLGVIKNFLGEAEYNKAEQRTLEQIQEAQTSIRNYFLEFSIGSDAYNELTKGVELRKKETADNFNNSNDTFNVTPVNIETDEIRKIRTLLNNTGKEVIAVKIGGKNGELHKGFIADPNSNAVFVDVDKLNSSSINDIYLGVIKTGIVETLAKNSKLINDVDPEIGKLFPKKTGEGYTEAEKYEIASKLLSDFSTIQDVVGTTKTFVGKIYSWIKNKIKISANKDTKNNLYKSLNKYFKALAIKAGTRDGCLKIAIRYNIDPTEILNEFNKLTADCLQQHFASFKLSYGMGSNLKEQGINFLQSGRKLEYRNTLTESKDFLNKDLYKKEFVDSILKQSEYSNFAHALNTYLNRNFGFYINPNSNTLENVENLYKEIDANFRLDFDEFVDKIMDLRESKDLKKAKKLINDLNSKNYSIETFFNAEFLDRIQLTENTKISFIYDESTSFSNATYNPASNEGIKIYINPNDYFYTSKTSSDMGKDLYHSLIHESIHAIFNAKNGYLGTNIGDLYRFYDDPANEKVKNKMVEILKQKGLDINPNLLAELTYMMTFGEYEAMRYGKPINKDFAKFMSDLGYTADFGTALVSDGFIADNGKLSGVGIFKGVEIGIESKTMTEMKDISDKENKIDILPDTESLSPEDSLIRAEELEALKVEFNDVKNKLLEDENEVNVDNFISILKELESNEDLSREDFNNIINEVTKIIKSLENKIFKNKILAYLVINNVELFPNISKEQIDKMEVIYAKSENIKKIKNIDDLKKSLEERIKEVVAKGDDAEIGELKHEIFENNGVLRSKFKNEYSREDLKQLDDLKKLFPKGKGFTTAELQRNIGEAIKSINNSKDILFELDKKYTDKYADKINKVLEKDNKDLTYSQLYDKHNSIIKLRDDMTLDKKQETKRNIVKEKVKKINSKKSQSPEQKTVEIIEKLDQNETLKAVKIESELTISVDNASEVIKNQAKEVSDRFLNQDDFFELRKSETKDSDFSYWAIKSNNVWDNANIGFLLSLESDFNKSPELYKILEENIKNSNKPYNYILLAKIKSIISNNMNFTNETMLQVQENIKREISASGSNLALQAISLGLNGPIEAVTKEMSEKFDGYTFDVSDKTAMKYIPELENREAYALDLEKEKNEITKKLSSKNSADILDNLEISILGQRLFEIDKILRALKNGSNKTLLDLLIKKLTEEQDFKLVEQIKTDIQTDLAEQMIASIEGGAKFKIIKLKDDGKFNKLSLESREKILTIVKNLESFRYLSMLSSPVTFFNNALNNMLMGGLDHITNSLEKVYGKRINWREGQLKYTDTINDKVREYVNKILPKDTAKKIMQGDKYNLSSDNKLEIGDIESIAIIKSSKAPILYKTIEAWRKWVDWGLSKGPLGDTPFTARHLILEMERMLSANLDYIRSETIKAYAIPYNIQVKNNPIDFIEKQLIIKLKQSKSKKAETLLKGLNGDVTSLLEVAPNETFQRIMDLAKEKANETFFRNPNILSKWVFNLKKKNPILGHIMSIPAPFIGVGYNIFKMAMHYSPLELLNTASILLEDRAVKNYDGELSLKQQTVQARLVESYARATVGTTLTFIGIILALAGFIKIDDDDYMGVCLKIGNLKIRLSDLSASSYALSTGAALIYASTNDRNILNDVLNVAYDTTLLGTIENIFAYSSSPTNYLENQSIAYFNQYIPAFLKLINKFIDPTIKAKTGGYFDRLWKNLASGLPIVSYAVGSRIDPYTGETYSRYGRVFDYFNIISPLKMASTKKTPLELEAKRLGTTTTFTRGGFVINDKKHNISGKQLENLSVFKGKYINNEYSKLVNSGKWNKMNDEEKKKTLEYIYSKATEIMKIEYWTNDLKNVYVTKTMDEYNRIKPYITNKLKIKYSELYRGSKYKES